MVRRDPAGRSCVDNIRAFSRRSDRSIPSYSRAAECRESMDALEMACNDTLLPIEIEAVKDFLSKIHDLRKDMLEALMGALREGKTLLDRLKELANEGTLDSRPDMIKDEADHGTSHRVHFWLESRADNYSLVEYARLRPFVVCEYKSVKIFL